MARRPLREITMLGIIFRVLSHVYRRPRRLIAATIGLLLVTSVGVGRADAANLADYQFSPGWATFGLALPRGAATGGVSVGQLATQTDIKNSWPDGSIRFAIVTAKILVAGSTDTDRSHEQ